MRSSPRFHRFLLIALLVSCGRSSGLSEDDSKLARWYDVVLQQPGPEVTDAMMRGKIEASGLPWKVRDRATGIEMVLVMPGEFLMGSPESEPGRSDDEGQRPMSVTDAFYLGATEISQAQWRQLMGPTDSFFADDLLPIDPSWNDLQEYLAIANASDAAGAGPLRLPTEAEWEFACRAGTTGRFSFVEAIRHDIVNFNDGDAKRAVVVDGKLEVEWNTPPAPECRMMTAPVGSLPPNAWGLHEMHGNLWEWCSDRYGSSGDELYVLRGGSWYDNPRYCRSAARDAGSPDTRSNRIGARLARTP